MKNYDARLKPVLNITTGKTYPSVTEAAADLGTSCSMLSKVLNGKISGYQRNQLCFISEMPEYVGKIADKIADEVWVTSMNEKVISALEAQLKEAQNEAEQYKIKLEKIHQLQKQKLKLEAELEAIEKQLKEELM